MTAVGSAAQEVVANVRDQFRQKPGIMDGSQQPDYASCVSIVTQAALREMIREPSVVVELVSQHEFQHKRRSKIGSDFDFDTNLTPTVIA